LKNRIPNSEIILYKDAGHGGIFQYHKEFVKNHLGYAEENIILIENGDVLELDGERAAVVGKRDVPRTFIDDSGFEEITSETVRQRRQMAYEGMVTLIVTVDAETGEVQGEPEIVARGFSHATVTRVQRMLYSAEYKRRQAPPGVKITRRSFGRDRRYPITNGFREA